MRLGPSSEAAVSPTETSLSSTEDYSQLLMAIERAVVNIENGSYPDARLRYIVTKLKDRGIQFYIPNANAVLNDSRFRNSLILMGMHIEDGDWVHVRAVAGNPLELRVPEEGR